jgi:hypothetical protein
MDAQDFRGQEGLPRFPQAFLLLHYPITDPVNRASIREVDASHPVKRATSLEKPPQMQTPQRRKLSQPAAAGK